MCPEGVDSGIRPAATRPGRPTHMIGEHAFCPTSGAALSRERHYDERGRPQRTPESDDLSPRASLEAPLTTGRRRSSKRALSTYFRRCHRRHAPEDDELYGRAALAVARLKRAAGGRDGRDVIVWYALGERLAREGFDVEWMAAHAEPRCPECGGRLAYEEGPDGPVARCGTSCTDDRRDHLGTIRRTVATLYERTFPDDVAPAHDDLALL